MANFEQLLPRFPTYQNALNEDGYKFGDHTQRQIKELFDQSKWEDRLLMLAFIMQRSELKIDNRPSFSNWLKKEIEMIDQDFLDDDPSSNPFIKCLWRYDGATYVLNRDNLEKIISDWETYSYNEKKEKLTLNLMGVYHTLFPSSLVVTTKLGEQCLSCCKDLSDNQQVKEYIDGLYYSLVSFTESAYSKTLAHQNNNENLYLHKYDFNWSEILHLVWKIDLISWWYRGYLTPYDPCWGKDVTTIPLSIGEYENSNTYFTECLLPMIFNAYGVDCKEYEKECYTMMYTWYSSETPPYSKEEMSDMIEDQWSEIHHHWTMKYGVLE